MAETRKLTYHARIGGTRKDPIFCDRDSSHEHRMVENAAACLPSTGVGRMGEVYEAADGVFTGAFFEYETREGGGKYSIASRGSVLKGRKRSEY